MSNELEATDLQELEKKLFDAISTCDVAELTKHLSQYKGSVDLMDENGMTPLQHASYKGNKEIVQMLLDRGADVNSGKHEYDYSALHFGGLSGSSEVCCLLMEAGAKSTAKNSIGRTPPQMAAFVGNYHTVATINNFVPRKEIVYFTLLHGQQTEPYLPPYLVEPVLKLIMEVNLHPVRIALNLQRCPILMDHLDKVKTVLEMLSKKEITQGSQSNEVMSFKYHYLAYVVNEIKKMRANAREKHDNSEDDKKHDVVEMFSKRLLKPGKDGALEYMDVFLKECVREFPYRESTLFHQMITTLAAKDAPAALTVVSSSINGQRGFSESTPFCNTCGEEKPAKKCSKCKNVQYCDRECQRLHWFVHKKACNRAATTPTVTSNVRGNVDTAELSSQLQNLIAS